MAAPLPPASDKTIKDTTKTVVEANASVAEAATGTTDAVKSGVKATQQTGAAVVKAVGEVGKAVGTPPEIKVTVAAPVIPVPPIDTSLKDISKQLMNAVGSLAYEKTVGKVMGVISPLGGTIDSLRKWKPQEALSKIGEGFLGKLNKFKGGEAAVSSQMEKALQKIGKGSEDLVNMTDAQRKEALARFAAEGKDTSELHNLLIGENKLSQAQLQAGAELIGERSEEDIAKGKGDARIDPASETSLQKMFRESQEAAGGVPPAGGGDPPKDEELKVEGGGPGDGIPFFAKMVESLEALQDIQANMLNMMVDDSAAASEAAAEAARRNLGKGDGGIKDAKVQEAKAGGFFSRMGGAIMNPMKAMGSGMKKIGKGIQGILTGIARGLMAFANPLVLVGVTFMALSLPILAAGLAAAFKVFDMIAGQGSAMDILTGIIESLGNAIGGILKDVLHGLGLFIGASGPFIEQFFLGISHIMRALAPIISALVPLFQTLITSVEKILTSKAFNETLQVIVNKIGDIVLAIIDLAKVLAPVLEVLFNNIGMIVTVIGNVILGVVNAIAGIIKTVGDVIIAVIENIGVVIDSVGNAVSGVINAVGGVVQTIGDVIVAIIDAIAAAVSKTIDSIVSGIERLSALDGSNLLVVAAALAGLAGALVLFAAGAAVAGALMPSKEDLASLADSVSKFGDIDATNFAAVGTGMEAIGKGLLFFGAGGALAAILNDPKGLTSVANSVAKFGAIDASNFAMVGTGIEAIGTGLLAFAGGGFLSSLAEGFGSLIGASDPVEKFQKFAKIGPGLKDASEGIKTLALAMKDFEKTVKEFDLSKVDEVAKGLAKIRDAQDPGALSKIGSIVGNIFGGDKEKSVEAGADAHSIPAMIAQTNLLLEQGFLTGPSALFGSPGIGTSAFMMARTGQKQLATSEEQLKAAEDTKVVAEKEIKSPVLTKVEIPEPEKFVYKPMKLSTPDVADFGGGTAVSVGDPRFKGVRQRREVKMVGRTRVPIEPLDTTAVTPMYQTGQVPPGQALMAGQMEANALATESSGTSSITDASSSTIVNNSNQSMMMPESDPNPHNMDFRPEERLFPS